jgi:hypothetical protein
LHAPEARLTARALLQHLPRVDAHRYRGEGRLLAAAREGVGPLARHVLGGVGGRHLLDRSGEGRERGDDRRWLRQGRLHHRGAGAVVGVGLRAEADHGLVDLGFGGDEPEESCSAPGEEDEEPGRERIERAPVPNLAGA